MDQSYLRMMMKVRHLNHPYSRKELSKGLLNIGRNLNLNYVVMSCTMGKYLKSKSILKQLPLCRYVLSKPVLF